MSGPELRRELDDFVRVLREFWGDDLVAVVLFGSQAAGTARADSDVDVLVVSRNFPASRLARRDLLRPALDRAAPGLRDRLSTILLTPSEAATTKPFYLDMTLHSEVLFDRDGFFVSVLTRLNERLRELGSRRVFDPDGYPYWILKPDARIGEEIVL
jgi:predicted nucleotidyltransferase